MYPKYLIKIKQNIMLKQKSILNFLFDVFINKINSYWKKYIDSIIC